MVFNGLIGHGKTELGFLLLFISRVKILLINGIFHIKEVPYVILKQSIKNPCAVRECSAFCPGVSRFVCNWKQAVSSALFRWSSGWYAGWTQPYIDFVHDPFCEEYFNLCPSKVLIRSPFHIKKIIFAYSMFFPSIRLCGGAAVIFL